MADEHHHQQCQCHCRRRRVSTSGVWRSAGTKRAKMEIYTTKAADKKINKIGKKKKNTKRTKIKLFLG